MWVMWVMWVFFRNLFNYSSAFPLVLTAMKCPRRGATTVPRSHLTLVSARARGCRPQRGHLARAPASISKPHVSASGAAMWVMWVMWVAFTNHFNFLLDRV